MVIKWMGAGAAALLKAGSGQVCRALLTLTPSDGDWNGSQRSTHERTDGFKPALLPGKALRSLMVLPIKPR